MLFCLLLLLPSAIPSPTAAAAGQHGSVLQATMELMSSGHYEEWLNNETAYDHSGGSGSPPAAEEQQSGSGANVSDEKWNNATDEHSADTSWFPIGSGVAEIQEVDVYESSASGSGQLPPSEALSSSTMQNDSSTTTVSVVDESPLEGGASGAKDDLAFSWNGSDHRLTSEGSQSPIQVDVDTVITVPSNQEAELFNNAIPPTVSAPWHQQGLHPFASLFRLQAWSERMANRQRKPHHRLVNWEDVLGQLGFLGTLPAPSVDGQQQVLLVPMVPQATGVWNDLHAQRVGLFKNEPVVHQADTDAQQTDSPQHMDAVIEQLRQIGHLPDMDVRPVELFDGQELQRCNGELHPIVAVYKLLKKNSEPWFVASDLTVPATFADIYDEYRRTICQVDYHLHCNHSWANCGSVEAQTFCPKRCGQTKCFQRRDSLSRVPCTVLNFAVRLHGYTGAEQPTYTNSCTDTESHDCGHLAERGDCFTNTNSMSSLCPDACHFCRFDELRLPFMPEAQRILLWLDSYNDGQYKAYADYVRSRTMVIHSKAKNGLC